MPTLIILIIVLGVGYSIIWWENYQKKLFIAKVIDGQNVQQNTLSQEFQLVLAQLKDKENLKLRRYNSMLVLPDGQEICYRFDDFIKMKTESKLRFEPSDTEWEILRGLVKKVLS